MRDLSYFDSVDLDGLEFCHQVYVLFEEIRQRTNGVSDIRMRKSHLEKKIIEELLPICKYIQVNYRAGRYIKVQWVDGNQQYDAKLTQNGFYIDQGFYPEIAYLEVTCAMHPQEYLSRERLEVDGFYYGYNGLRRKKDKSIESVITDHNISDLIRQDAEHISREINKKTQKNYPSETILIIQVYLHTIYAAYEWEEIIKRVESSFKIPTFKEIFIYDNTQHHMHTFFNHN